MIKRIKTYCGRWVKPSHHRIKYQYLIEKRNHPSVDMISGTGKYLPCQDHGV